MPKRKGGRKKRGGGKLLSNPGNTHNARPFGSDQGMVSGCAGCVGGDVQIGSGCTLSNQASAQQSATRGISRLMNGITGRVGKIQNGGGNVAETTFKDLQNAAKDGMGFGRVPVASVQNCGVSNSTAMGAGQRAQMGGGQTASCVNSVNNLGTAGYGLNVPPTGKLNGLVRGSGYPVVSPYDTNKCGGGKTKKRKRKQKKRTKRRTKRRTKKHKRKGKKRRTRRKRGGGVSYLQDFQQEWNSRIGFPHAFTGGKKLRKTRKKGKKKRKKMKGGYAQFASNNPNTPGYSSPKVGPLPWATGPLSKSRQINCQNNYNHYTGKSSASPVLDKAAPVTPFGGH
jgi:hypothetical protein